jgi:CRP-like cAMP-binding protein
MSIIKNQPEKMGQLLLHLAKQVRDMDDLALVQAFAPETRKVEHALSRLWRSADTDSRDPNVRIAKIGPQQIAKSAQIREDEVLRVLETEKAKGVLDYGKRNIRFFQEPVMEDIHEVMSQ